LTAQGGQMLFVGTKKQAQDAIREEAERCGAFYVNTRWLGGMLTNFHTIKQSIDRLKKLDEMLEDAQVVEALTKKELQGLRHEREKLLSSLGTMGLEEVRDLREKTGAGLLDCQKALGEAGGDVERAVRILRERGLAKAAKKTTRTATDGAIGAYIHPPGKIGVLIEVNCETDFVAKTPEFQQLVKDLAMQVAASSPRYVSREEVPAAELEAEREIYRKQALQSGKPEK